MRCKGDDLAQNFFPVIFRRSKLEVLNTSARDFQRAFLRGFDDYNELQTLPFLKYLCIHAQDDILKYLAPKLPALMSIKFTSFRDECLGSDTPDGHLIDQRTGHFRANIPPSPRLSGPLGWFRTCSKLEEVNFNPWNNFVSSRDLIDLARGCPLLRVLKLEWIAQHSDTDFGDHTIEVIASHCRNMESLMFEHLYFRPGLAVKSLVALGRYCPNLIHLFLGLSMSIQELEYLTKDSVVLLSLAFLRVDLVGAGDPQLERTPSTGVIPVILRLGVRLIFLSP
jgi:hypothetical protein